MEILMWRDLVVADLPFQIDTDVVDRVKKCLIADKQIKTDEEKRAKRMEMTSSNSSKICPLCRFLFDSFEYLLRHLRDMKDDTYHRNETAKCIFCDEILSGDALLFHFQAEHSAIFSGNDINRSKDMAIASRHNKRKHHCPHCDKMFVRPSDLTRHLRIHTGEKPYCCEKCQKKFTNEANLKTHLQTHDRQNLTEFTCGYCSKNFLSRSSLKLHIRIHTGEKPFACHFPDCNESFRTNKHKLSHIRRVHENPTGKLIGHDVAGQILESIKTLKSDQTKALPISQNSAFSAVKPQKEVILSNVQVVVRVQLRCGSASVIHGVNTHHSPTDIVIDIATLRNLSKENYAMKIPLKKTAVPEPLFILLDPRTILMRLEGDAASNISFIVYPFPTAQVGPNQPIAVQSKINTQTRQLPSFLIECFLQSQSQISVNNNEIRQTLAQSCLDFAERF